jgi:hypothetical protein
MEVGNVEDFHFWIRQIRPCVVAPGTLRSVAAVPRWHFTYLPTFRSCKGFSIGSKQKGAMVRAGCAPRPAIFLAETASAKISCAGKASVPSHAIPVAIRQPERTRERRARSVGHRLDAEFESIIHAACGARSRRSLPHASTFPSRSWSRGRETRSQTPATQRAQNPFPELSCTSRRRSRHRLPG